MDICMNVLEDSGAFISVATLVVIVLLVWAQLSAHGDLDKDFNLSLGFAWTYLAIFFALIAVAIFVLWEGVTPCAKGVLVLSFLMTMFNVFILVGLTIFKITFSKSFSKPVPKIESPLEKIVWGLGWLVTLVGLVLISFSLVGISFGISCCCCKWLGVVLVVAVLVVVLVAAAVTANSRWGRRRCLAHIRWDLYRKRRIATKVKTK